MGGWSEVHVEEEDMQMCHCRQAIILKIHKPKEPGDRRSTKSYVDMRQWVDYLKNS